MLDGGDFCEIGLAVVVEVVHGTYDIEVLVVREEKDCDTQVGWGGHGVMNQTDKQPIFSSEVTRIHRYPFPAVVRRLIVRSSLDCMH